jgi:hypothetical protein
LPSEGCFSSFLGNGTVPNEVDAGNEENAAEGFAKERLANGLAAGFSSFLLAAG